MSAEFSGWQPDPFDIHELRYLSDDGKPTRLVKDNGVESYDDPPEVEPHASMSLVPEPPALQQQSFSPPSFCTGCGASLSAEDYFCARCGHTVALPQAEPSMPAPVDTSQLDQVSGAPGAGWYPDDSDSSLIRYWDGHKWTNYTKPRFALPPHPMDGNALAREQIRLAKKQNNNLKAIRWGIFFAGLAFFFWFIFPKLFH